jgi:hypothetical protein
MHRDAHALCAPRCRRPILSRGAFDNSGSSSNNMAGLPHAEAATNEDDGQCAVSRCRVPSTAFPPLPALRFRPSVARGVRCGCCGGVVGAPVRWPAPLPCARSAPVRTGSGGAVGRRTAVWIPCARIGWLGLGSPHARLAALVPSRLVPCRPVLLHAADARMYLPSLSLHVFPSCRTRWCVW